MCVECILLFVFQGMVGGLGKYMVERINMKKPSVWIIPLGAIGGYTYYFFHTGMDLPNSGLSIIVGYAAADFFSSLSILLFRVLNKNCSRG